MIRPIRDDHNLCFLRALTLRFLLGARLHSHLLQTREVSVLTLVNWSSVARVTDLVLDLADLPMLLQDVSSREIGQVEFRDEIQQAYHDYIMEEGMRRVVDVGLPPFSLVKDYKKGEEAFIDG